MKTMGYNMTFKVDVRKTIHTSILVVPKTSDIPRLKRSPLKNDVIGNVISSNFSSKLLIDLEKIIALCIRRLKLFGCCAYIAEIKAPILTC